MVELEKERGALGLRIAGGNDKPIGGGFIRIKQLTATSAASKCGRLREGDIILQVPPWPLQHPHGCRVGSGDVILITRGIPIPQVNEVSLTDVPHREAAEALLQSGDRVCLHMYRPTQAHWWQRDASSRPLAPIHEETTATAAHTT